MKVKNKTKLAVVLTALLAVGCVSGCTNEETTASAAGVSEGIVSDSGKTLKDALLSVDTPKVDAKDEVEKDDKEAAAEPEQSKQEQSVETPTPSQPAQPNAPSQQQPSSSSQSSGNSGGSSNSAPSTPSQQQQPSAPVHSHSWQAITEDVWVVDQAAWTEEIWEVHTVCNCGQILPSSEHIKQHALNGEPSNYGSKSVFMGTVEHPEEGHYETITTGYSCSCGAVQ